MSSSAGESLTPQPPAGQILIYEDGGLNLQVRLDGETVWLTQRLMADLYQVSVKTINEHLINIYSEGELDSSATIRKFRIVQTEGTRQVKRNLDHYSLEAILAVGMRVRSARGTVFRQWAIARLGELLVKGFTMDDERIKAGRTLGDDYFEELLARIRDIRSSERLFYLKVLDIYATSIDYDGKAETSQLFFKTVQNKMHWAAHGHTAAEVIAERADASQPNMGLTSWKTAPHGKVRKGDVGIAKNYLSQDELEALNRIVTAYLEFAELQALNRKPMYMSDWIAKLDAFLKLSDREILTHAGKIKATLAKAKAEAEYERFHQLRLSEPEPVDRDFCEVVGKIKEIEAETKRKTTRKKKSADSGEGGGGGDQ
ncbi:MAG: virulence RhuM family protein [Cyanobacteria bacterium]|nr:virulence RhuM family protein [Cyanobacteriota bacterium]